MLLRSFKRHERRMLRAYLSADLHDVIPGITSFFIWWIMPILLFVLVGRLTPAVESLALLMLVLSIVWMLVGSLVFFWALRPTLLLFWPRLFSATGYEKRMLQERLEHLDSELG